MTSSKPGFTAIVETEEIALFASGPDGNHRQFNIKGDIKSTVTDAANSPITTLRGGLLLGVKDSDGLLYKYDPTATDGTQKVAGVLPLHLSMLDRLGAVEDKFQKVFTGGILKNASVDCPNFDKMAAAQMLRSGFMFAQLEPHGSAFLTHPRARYFKTADYTVLDGDNGNLIVADGSGAVNFTLPSLAAVGPGFTVWLFNGANQNMVVTAGAVDTIRYDDTAGGKATTLTWSTANQKMGASVMMRADYDAAGALSWYPLQVQRTVVAA